MIQSKRHSLLESLVNVAFGYLVAVGAQLFIFPFFNIDITINDNLLIGLFFTVVSIIRSYLLRRFFTRRTENLRYKDKKISLVFDDKERFKIVEKKTGGRVISISNNIIMYVKDGLYHWVPSKDILK